MFNIEVHDQAVRSALTALAKKVADAGPLLLRIGAGILSRTDARFGKQTGPDGAPWKPKKKPNGRPILSGETGDLRRQIVMGVAGDRLEVTATAAYAAIHQFGGPIQRAAGQVTVRHRTNAKGELLRSKIMGGRGLVFAKASHKRAVARTFARRAFTIRMPPRPFLPIRADGSLYPAEQAAILAEINAWLAGQAG
jgi:phage virion morphogenesis protein